MYRNTAHALVESLRLLLTEGATVLSRNGDSKELRAHVMQIERPVERVLVMPERQNNVFASLAETLWVLGGRDDLEYLVQYLPRAGDFSDDGKVWRGAYGPRLRNWKGVDQVKEVARLIKEDPQTRRGTMIIFDPGQDFVVSKDIPCNNWLHFLARDGKLHLTLGLRSNDAIWGFSGINAFEWSTLLEMMAHWTGTTPGTFTYVVGSFHLYAHHYERAEKIVAQARRKSLYDFGFHGPRFSTPFDQFDKAMAQVFALETEIRNDKPGIDGRLADVKDEFLRTSLQMLRVYSVYKAGAPGEVIQAKLDALPSCDLRIGAIDFLTRQKRLQDKAWLKLRPEEKLFFDDYWSPRKEAELEGVYNVLRVLHEKKTRSYGNSWRKHGEVLGVFANITRKYDRIEAVLNGAKATADETLVDTLADLAVYAGKYLTYIAEVYPQAFATFMGPDAGDLKAYLNNEGLNAVIPWLLQQDRKSPQAGATLEACLESVRTHYKALERFLTSEAPFGHGEAKARAATDLSLAAARAIVFVARREPATYNDFAEDVEVM